jgi:glycerol-3-phosphate acyltransferase PlsY
MLIALYYLGSFVLGSIPFGWIVARMKGIDIRKVGSGNIGATNVKRALGTKLGIFVLFLDVIKSAIPGMLATTIIRENPTSLSIGDLAVLGGVVAVFGHIFSPFLRFRGGKGIASGLGALLGVAPIVGTCCFSVFLVMMVFTRIVSISSVIAASSILVFGWVFQRQYGFGPIFFSVYTLVVLLIWIKHIPNLKRLAKGEEPKFSWKREAAPEKKEDGDGNP